MKEGEIRKGKYTKIWGYGIEENDLWWFDKKAKGSILTLYIERHNLTTEKNLQKKKLELVLAHIQLSAALGRASKQ